MARYSAQIPIDPNGYRWVNVEGWRPGGSLRDYAVCHCLQATLHEKWQERLNRYGPVNFQEHTYDPFVREPALFRIFASLEQTESAIVQFANRYGDIASPQQIMEEEGVSLAQ